jgi:glycosyltransferase involved in cell wall biosynthesis
MNKILFIHHAAGWGGAPQCMVKLINDIDHSKYEAEVLLLKDSVVAQKLIENGIKFRVAESGFYKRFYEFFGHSEAGYIKWYRIDSFFRLGISWILSRYYFAGKELDKHEFDLVHLNSSVLTDWLAPAKKRGKVIIHVREPFRKGNLDLLRPFFASQMRKYADRIVAISEDNARRVGILHKTEIIYDYSECPAIPPLESSYASKKVLYLGGSSTSKGFYPLVDALDYLDKDIKILFAGSYVTTGKTANIKELIRFFLSRARKRNAAIKKISNHPNVVLLGMIYNVSEYLKEVCCLVSPLSVPHFSDPIIEANMYRKPAIGSDVEGMDEIIKHEVNGLIVPKNNPQALAHAINLLTSNSRMAKDFGEAGYIAAIKKFTKENVRQIELIYDQLTI